MTNVSPNALVGEVGEHALLPFIHERLSQNALVEVGPGDDGAVVAAPDGRVVISTDLMVAGRHFRNDWSTAHDVGRRLAVANISDINAMGAVATSLVVGMVLPTDTTVGWVLEFADGLAAECDVVGAAVIGGDLSGGEQLVLSATVLGDLEGRSPIRRSGARAGDVVAVCGRLGWAQAGVSILRRGFKAPRVLVNAHRSANPPYDAGPRAAAAGATAMIDTSDGLVADLGHIARASGVSIVLESDRFEIAEELASAASALNVDPLTWVLAGGEDHSLAATFPPGQDLPEGFIEIGTVTEPLASPVVLVDGHMRPDLQGYDHFR